MPGWGRRSAQDALAETGADMSRFPHPGTWPPGRAAPRWTISPASETAVPSPRKATGTWPACSARPPSRSANPDPRRRPLPADCPKTWQGQSPGRPRQHPAEGLPQAPVLARHALPGSRPGLLRTPGHDPPPDRLPRRQARRPRLRGHPRPHLHPGLRRLTTWCAIGTPGVAGDLGVSVPGA